MVENAKVLHTMRLRILIAAASLMVFGAALAGAQSKDSFTVGNLTFDFAAPQPPLSAVQTALFAVAYENAAEEQREHAGHAPIREMAAPSR